MRNDTCTVTTCEMPVKRKGLCYGHYMKQWRYGDPLRDRVCGPNVDLAGVRFGALIVRQYVGSGRLHQVPGVVPSPREFVAGDRFAPRSSHPTVGLDTVPTMRQVDGVDHLYARTDELAEILAKESA